MSRKIYDSVGCADAMVSDGYQAEQEEPAGRYWEGRWRDEVAANDRLRAALNSIAGWQKVNISGEYEHGLRDIIRSITECAAAALDASTVPSQHGASHD